MTKGVKIDLAIIAVLVAGMTGWYLLSRPSRNDVQVVDQLLQQRMEAAWTSWKYLGSEFPEVVYEDPSLNDVGILELEGNSMSIILALSNEACNPGQVREMKVLDSLYQQLGNEIAVIGLYYNGQQFSPVDDRDSVLRLRHTSRAGYPVYFTDDDRFANYMAQGQYPLMFLLDGKTVVSSFAGIPNDDVFSHMYMRSLTQIVSSMLEIEPRP